jgi:hypothetical protein
MAIVQPTAGGSIDTLEGRHESILILIAMIMIFGAATRRAPAQSITQPSPPPLTHREETVRKDPASHARQIASPNSRLFAWPFHQPVIAGS